MYIKTESNNFSHILKKIKRSVTQCDTKKSLFFSSKRDSTLSKDFFCVEHNAVGKICLASGF